MDWRHKFDPTRFRPDLLLARARRLSNIRALGEQVISVRRLGMRGEFIVPLAALVILAGALILSALTPDPAQTPQVGEAPSATGSATPPLTTTATAVAGYPFSSSSPSATIGGTEPFASPIPDITSTATLSNTIVAIGPDSGTGYPGPGDVPQPIGPPPGGGVPPSDSSGFNPPPGDPITVPTPALIQPTFAPPVSSYPSPPNNPRPPQPAQNNPQPPRGAPNPSPTPAPTDGLVTTPTTTGTDTALTPGTTQQPVQPTAVPTSPITPTPEPTPVPPTPTARPAEVLTGNVRWTAANSPVVLQKDHALAAGSSLTIDPGVEVRFAPGVQLTIGGALRAQGTASAPVRFVGTAGRWEGIVGTQGSSIILDQVQVRQAGQSGTAVSSTGGALVIRNASFADNGGGIVALGSMLDLRNTQIFGNAIGGPAVNVRLPGRSEVNIVNTIVGGNGTPSGAPQVLLTGEQTAGPITVSGNLFVGGAGAGVTINTSAPLTGSIRCNGFSGGTVGLQLAARRPDTAGFNLAIDNNAFEQQTTYGATGTLAFNLTNNWWSDPSGPHDVGRNPQGRGVPVGVNLQFQPWLTGRPACAPTR
ncbi:MAG TPA: right-handed parallel beta-helix repeat-containing protein [Herpetosiphonaceae bacterium]